MKLRESRSRREKDKEGALHLQKRKAPDNLGKKTISSWIDLATRKVSGQKRDGCANFFPSYGTTKGNGHGRAEEKVPDERKGRMIGHK